MVWQGWQKKAWVLCYLLFLLVLSPTVCSQEVVREITESELESIERHTRTLQRNLTERASALQQSENDNEEKERDLQERQNDLEQSKNALTEREHEIQQRQNDNELMNKQLTESLQLFEESENENQFLQFMNKVLIGTTVGALVVGVGAGWWICVEFGC